MDLATLRELNTLRRQRIAAAVITDLTRGQNEVATASSLPTGALRDAVAAAMKARKSATATIDGLPYFINVYIPPIRLVIIGAVHISQALVPMAKLAGFDALIIDPRTAFATAERFAQAELIADWPEDVLPKRPLDVHTALVTLTHDPKIDDFALAEALRNDCFYVGALGSRKTHQARLERLKTYGFDDGALSRIHGPIGLNIGSVTPAEIAVSILAEIISMARSGNDLSLQRSMR